MYVVTHTIIKHAAEESHMNKLSRRNMIVLGVGQTQQTGV